MNKKQTLILGLLGLLGLGLGLWFLMSDVCQPDTWMKCRSIDSAADMITSLLSFALPLTVFSLITYKMRDEVYRAWLRFSHWWIPLSFALVLFSSSYKPANIVGISNQTFFGVLAWGLYIIISIALIIWKHSATRRSRHV